MYNILFELVEIITNADISDQTNLLESEFSIFIYSNAKTNKTVALRKHKVLISEFFVNAFRRN